MNTTLRWFLLLLFSFSLHAGFFFSFARGTHQSSQTKKYQKLRFQILKPRPRPPLPLPPKPRVAPRPLPRPKPKKKRLRKPKPRRKKQEFRRTPPPPPNQTPPKKVETTPQPTFGLTKSSLGKGPGKIAFRQGNTLMMDPDKNPPKRVLPYAPPRNDPPPRRIIPFQPVPLLDIDENPRELQKTKALYPPDAKRDGIEAVVVLSVQIRKNGKVRRVRVISIRPPQATRYDFGASAIRALQHYRFAPARAKGQPVDVVVRYIYRFELDD